jgi:hypothetical protein
MYAAVICTYMQCDSAFWLFSRLFFIFLPLQFECNVLAVFLAFALLDILLAS